MKFNPYKFTALGLIAFLVIYLVIAFVSQPDKIDYSEYGESGNALPGGIRKFVDGEVTCYKYFLESISCVK